MSSTKKTWVSDLREGLAITVAGSLGLILLGVLGKELGKHPLTTIGIYLIGVLVYAVYLLGRMLQRELVKGRPEDSDLAGMEAFYAALLITVIGSLLWLPFLVLTLYCLIAGEQASSESKVTEVVEKVQPRAKPERLWSRAPE